MKNRYCYKLTALVAAAALLCITILSACSQGRTLIICPGSGSLVIAAAEPMTGAESATGAAEMLGFEYAYSLRNAVSDGEHEYPVTLLGLNTGASSKESKAAVKTLLSAGAAAVLGLCGENGFETVADGLSGTDIPIVTATLSDPEALDRYKSAFCVNYSQSYLGKAFAEFASRIIGAEYAVIVTDGSPEGALLADSFSKRLEYLGGEVTAVYTDPQEAQEIVGVVSENGTECIFIAAPTATDTFLRAAAGKLTIPIITVNDSGGKLPTLPVGLEAEVYSPSPFDPDKAAELLPGYEEWIAADSVRLFDNGGITSPSPSSVLAFDAYNTLLDAVEATLKAGVEDTAALTGTLREGSYVGVSGTFAFGNSGSAESKEIKFRLLNESLE